MQERNLPSPQVAGDAGASPLVGLGSGRLRDAGWAPLFQSDRGLRSPGRTQVLHRWALATEQSAAGLVFQALDGNPRHGVLALFVEQGELHGAIEILERQGRWLVMPDGLRARTLAVGALARSGGRMTPRSSIAGTPDRRFIFFNARLEGGTTTLVERRPDEGLVVT